MNLVAVNHWDTAIATHSKNHPDARRTIRSEPGSRASPSGNGASAS
jgi:hypothetical protein